MPAREGKGFLARCSANSQLWFTVLFRLKTQSTVWQQGLIHGALGKKLVLRELRIRRWIAAQASPGKLLLPQIRQEAR
jgi:hypothetical protein